MFLVVTRIETNMNTNSKDMRLTATHTWLKLSFFSQPNPSFYSNSSQISRHFSLIPNQTHRQFNLFASTLLQIQPPSVHLAQTQSPSESTHSLPATLRPLPNSPKSSSSSPSPPSFSSSVSSPLFFCPISPPGGGASWRPPKKPRPGRAVSPRTCGKPLSRTRTGGSSRILGSTRLGLRGLRCRFRLAAVAAPSPSRYFGLLVLVVVVGGFNADQWVLCVLILEKTWECQGSVKSTEKWYKIYLIHLFKFLICVKI